MRNKPSSFPVLCCFKAVTFKCICLCWCSCLSANRREGTTHRLAINICKMSSLTSCISLLRHRLRLQVYNKALRRAGVLEGCISPADLLFHGAPWCDVGLQGPGECWKGQVPFLLKGKLCDGSGQCGKKGGLSIRAAGMFLGPSWPTAVCSGQLCRCYLHG